MLGLLTACLSVALVLTLTEVVLRLVGYGHPTSYYRTAEDPDGKAWIRENRWFTAPYFSRALVRRPPAMRLPAEKEAGTYRIFVLGSSAAMGDPELSFSIARVLEEMLRDAYPEVRFEVSNAAITAVNSHVVRQVAEDCADLQPDLYIVYEGHNEVIGPFGPATVFTPFIRSTAMIRLLVSLRQSRIGQLASDLAARVTAGRTQREWGGMQMFLDQAIRQNDPRLESVRAHFQDNLEAIIDSADDAGARTLLCTVLTNQRDFAPFLPANAPGLSDEDLARWQAAVALGDSAFAAGDLAAAERHYLEAEGIDDSHAGLSFRVGRLDLSLGRDEAAHAQLQKALDQDTLRFRTSSNLNDAMRQAAAAEPDACTLVDLDKRISAASPYGIVGDESLYEHVHLTLSGAYAIAQALFPEVSADLRRRHLISDTADEPLDYATLRIHLGYTVYEQGMIARSLLQRFSAAPFTAQADNPARLQLWQERATRIEQMLSQPEADPALTDLYQQALDASPHDWILERNFGMALVAMGYPERAIHHLEQARLIIDDDVDTLFALATAYAKTGDDVDAKLLFDRVRTLEPRYPGLQARRVSESE